MKRVLIAGASGFIGAVLTSFLQRNSCEVTRLVRREPREKSEIFWNPERKQLNLDELEGFDFVINLCGENIANRRWTNNYKKKLLDSRLQTTQLLVDSIRKLKAPPKKFLCASAVGIYGSHPATNSVLSEECQSGTDFLAEICKAWESSAAQAEMANIDVICLRFAAVLDPRGGMLKKVSPPFRWGIGAVLGTGRQYFSWIALHDLLRAIYFLLTAPIKGPVNLSSPSPVTNQEFSNTLAALYQRPCFLQLPKPFLNLVFGKDFTEQVLLADQKAYPKKLLEAGFTFDFPTIGETLKP